MKPSELLDKPEKWTKGYLARTTGGRPINADDPNATCWCVFGALARCEYTGEAWIIAVSKLRFEIGSEYISIPEWNDAEETTYEQVIDVLKKAGL